MNDPIVDMIIRIKNGYMTKNEQVTVPHSNYRKEVLNVLKKCGYIKDYSILGDVKKHITIDLIYEKGTAKITDVKVVSKPGRRFYVAYTDLKPVMNGMGHSILSTPKGIMTNGQARRAKTGGELLFMIW